MRRIASAMGVALLAAALLAVRAGLAGEGKGKNKEEAVAIHKNAEAFVAAFNKNDAKAVAAFWTQDGDFVDQTGRHLRGRKAIEKAFRGFFAENKGAKVQ